MRSSRYRFPTFACPTCLLGVVLLAGCDLDGNSLRYPGASVFEPPARDFHFHYLSPPWRIRPKPADLIAHLSVDVLDQFNPTSNAFSHELRLSYATGTSREAIDAVRLVLAKAGHSFRSEVAPVRALTGEVGWDLLSTVQTSAGLGYHRETFFTASSGKPVRFSLTSAYPLDEQDVDDLLGSFSAAPDDGSVTPPRVRDRGVASADAGAP